MSDRLALANAIEDAGIPRDKAQTLASVIINLVRDTAATKADLADVRADLRFLQWQIGVGFALVIAIAGPSLWLLLRVAAKVGAM